MCLAAASFERTAMSFHYKQYHRKNQRFEKKNIFFFDVWSYNVSGKKNITKKKHGKRKKERKTCVRYNMGKNNIEKYVKEEHIKEDRKRKYMSEKNIRQEHLFTNKMLRALVIPLILEQLLNSLMGTVDTMMVSNVGSVAISAVSLVDSINVLVIQAFAAMAAGGAIVCAQYFGRRDIEKTKETAKQLLFITGMISLVITGLCLIFCSPLLKFIFGEVEAAVMEASKTYFFYTALSFPFIAIYGAGASIFRAQENTKGPMTISVISNILNICGNAILIFSLDMGVAGAAISTLISRAFCAVVVLWQLRLERQPVVIRDYWKIKPEWKTIKAILSLGIPSGIENSMFQLGKLAIQSTVSTLGTVAIAAQAMTNSLEYISGVAPIGVGIGMMTVVGECIGAGRKDEAEYYIKKLTKWAEVVLVVACLSVFALTKPITILGGMERESAELCFKMVCWITLVKPVAWLFSFMPAYGMRAAGDVRFSMITSCCTMWFCRYLVSVVLIRFFGFGPMGVWIGMFADWAARSIVFGWRFKSRRWMKHSVV